MTLIVEADLDCCPSTIIGAQKHGCRFLGYVLAFGFCVRPYSTADAGLTP